MSGDLFEAEHQGFGQFPRALVLSGALAASAADRVELLVLLGIAAHADKGFSAYPPMADLATCAGVTERSARRAIRRLEERGIITVDHGGGRHKANTYTINPDAQGVLVSTTKPGRPERPGNTAETRTPAALNPDACCRNPDAKASKPGRSRRPPNNKQLNNINNTLAADAAKRVRPRDEVFEAVAEVCGYQLDQLTKDARGRINSAAKQLRDIGVEPDEIRRRAANWSATYTYPLTPQTLTTHWPALANGQTPKHGGRNGQQFTRPGEHPEDAAEIASRIPRAPIG